MDNMKEFNGAAEFAKFLRDNATLMSLIPFGEELVALDSNVEKGCKCRRGQRLSNRDHVYKTMITNIVALNEDIQKTFKEYSGETSVSWKENGEVLLEI